MRYVDKMPPRTGNYGPKYPWREIAESGKVVLLQVGDDNVTDLDQARNALYQWALVHGYRVRTRMDHDRGELYVQLVGK